MTKRFSNVDPGEKLVLTFQFAKGLATGETLVAPTVSVTVDYGTDATPSAIIVGSQVSGTDVLVSVAGQKVDVDYHIKVLCTTSNANKKLAVAGVLPCRTA